MCDSIKDIQGDLKKYKPYNFSAVPLVVETIYDRIWKTARKMGREDILKKGLKISNTLMKIGIDKRRKIFKQILDNLGGNLDMIICGGANLDPKYEKGMHDFGIDVFNGYGITECSPAVTCNRPGKCKPGSVGVPVDCCQIKIHNPDDEGVGEIYVKGTNVMLGYYGNDEATAEVFTEDGWFRTGDVGYIDADGYIYITGRKKNIIILSNGKNIFPEEIEEHLYTSPLIGECVVIGRKNSAGETRITAVIYPSDEAPELEGKSDEEKLVLIREAVNGINRSLPVYKQVRDVELRSEEFEKTTTRKIKRFLVK